MLGSVRCYKISRHKGPPSVSAGASQFSNEQSCSQRDWTKNTRPLSNRHPECYSVAKQYSDSTLSLLQRHAARVATNYSQGFRRAFLDLRRSTTASSISMVSCRIFIRQADTGAPPASTAVRENATFLARPLNASSADVCAAYSAAPSSRSLRFMNAVWSPESLSKAARNSSTSGDSGERESTLLSSSLGDFDVLEEALVDDESSERTRWR
eukprot:TRINITY_DN2567_c0_g1_i14.p1 TRINITY_DN2567_c0_g1~~TRINITY_DN2567_c0_g1_i14.p1  ORF type:complete len:211 (-),score=13.09 TRINITY_DN2567_c0_g1_i14:25-657(-)